MTIKRLNPNTLHKNPAFTQVAIVSSNSTLIFVGGQNGVNAAGEIVGQDLASQTEQTLKNLAAALDAAGATMNDVIKMTIYVAQGQSIQDGFTAFQKMGRSEPPTISVLMVAGFANPQFLVEIEAVAAIGGSPS